MGIERKPVPFDTSFFSKLKEEGKGKDVKETFKFIYQNNHWTSNDSISGKGSDDIQTKAIRKTLPELVKTFNIKTFIDIPCGDFNWMNKVNLDVEKYIGGDIVPDIIESNNKLYANDKFSFQVLNLIEDKLPEGDLLFCRDCLVHLSFEDIQNALTNIKNSNIKYLLTTTFTECTENKNITTGDWRILNFELAPFNFPKPLFILNEGCTEEDGSYADKSLALWNVKSL